MVIILVSCGSEGALEVFARPPPPQEEEEGEEEEEDREEEEVAENVVGAVGSSLSLPPAFSSSSFPPLSPPTRFLR